MTEWYIPPHITQRTGDRCQFSNCWAATGAWMHRAATGGTAKVSPEDFKKAAGGGSGNPNPVTRCGTGNESDLVRGLGRLGVRGALLRVSWAQARDILSAPRRAVYGIAVDYDAWPAAKDCMNGTAGPDVNHMVGIITGETPMVMNPLCTDYQDVDVEVIVNAAQKLSRQNGREGIYLTRVLRPVPENTEECERKVADLEAVVDEQREILAQVLTLANEIRSLTLPVVGQ